MKKWQGTNNLKDVAPTIYNKWIYFYLKKTFEDELGTGFKRFFANSCYEVVVKQQISNESSCGGISVPKLKKETRVEITKSFKETIISLENQLGESVESWTWDKVCSRTNTQLVKLQLFDNYLM
jgi:penicillin amidase